MTNSVSIVLAVYNPRPDWLHTQLCSIGAQDYSNIEVIAINDASDNLPHSQIENIFRHSLKNVPYRLYKNEKTAGYNKTFETLTKMANGTYISYCDQDDIWEKHKTTELVLALTQHRAVLAYASLSVIDAGGGYLTSDLRSLRRRLKYFEGYNLARILLFRNFINGNSMLTHTKTAKAALPFVKDMTYDHWLALWCAASGKIAFVPRGLVQYRLHNNNQSAVMAGISSREDYLKRRILSGLSRFEQFEKRLSHAPELETLIKDGQDWLKARKNWFQNAENPGSLWKFRTLGKEVSMFELFMARLPEPLFMAAVSLVKRGIL